MNNAVRNIIMIIVFVVQRHIFIVQIYYILWNILVRNFCCALRVSVCCISTGCCSRILSGIAACGSCRSVRSCDHFCLSCHRILRNRLIYECKYIFCFILAQGLCQVVSLWLITFNIVVGNHRSVADVSV